MHKMRCKDTKKNRHEQIKFAFYQNMGQNDTLKILFCVNL